MFSNHYTQAHFSKSELFFTQKYFYHQLVLIKNTSSILI